MIVWRWTMRVKSGRMKEWVEVYGTNLAKADNPEFYHMYISRSDPELLALDLEFENLAEKEKFWEEWQKRPEHVAIKKAAGELVDEWLDNEIWTLA